MQSRIRCAFVLVSVAMAMTFLFWWPLYGGAGFIGGDLYSYFFPQKAFYADCLKVGRFPLWNDLTGFGYPVLGESQTGAAYPFHLVCYLCFDLNTAYNVEHLLHYMVCFVGTWLFARRLGLSNAGAQLAAIVFTYGWFPPRACLEWAILTGAWMPVALWCVESFLQLGTWRYAIGLSVAIGFQLLAGHFHLAFMTMMLVVTWFAYRLWRRWNSGFSLFPSSLKAGLQQRHAKNAFTQLPFTAAVNGTGGSRRAIVGFVLALTAGAGLAAIQLLPTWELKQRSSRVVSGGDYDPAYGHMPPLYVSQLVLPWRWYSLWEVDEDSVVRDAAEFAAPWHWFGPARDAVDPSQTYDLNQAIQRCHFAAVNAGTNKIEAHCYCGLVPICLAIWAMMIWIRDAVPLFGRLRPNSALQATGGQCEDSAPPKTPEKWRQNRSTFEKSAATLTVGADETLFDRTGGYWLIVGLLALVYATGLLLPIGLHLPGFSFFRGPGRYGIVTTLAIALFAGRMLSALTARFSARVARILLLTFVFSSTCGDLWLVSRMVKYTYMTYPPRIAFREASEVRLRLLADSTPPRLFAPGPNACNLLGVSCVPWYLGIAPAEYVDPKLQMPAVPEPSADGRPTPCPPELLEWLGRSGVTHVLNFEPLDRASWQVDLIWSGVDPFLNRVWGRNEPIYLYRFRAGDVIGKSIAFSGRTYAADENCRVIPKDWKSIPAESRRYELNSDQPGTTEVVVTELQYPGWTVRQGVTPLEAKSHGIFRAVRADEAGDEVVWTYRPRSVYCGAAISILTLVLLAFVAHMRFWHPRLVDRVVSWLFRATPSDRPKADV